MRTKYWRTVLRYPMVKEVMQIRFQDSETSLLVSKKAVKNYLDDSEGTQKSCLDVVFKLLATTTGTSSSSSLPESVHLLESQLQVERHRSDVLRLEAEGLRKSL